MTAAPVVISGALRDYDWGRVDGLARWCGTTTGEPQAELWFGAHPHAPSRLVAGAGSLSDAWPTRDVPLLVKLLAARTPLSLQVHPDGDLAAEWLVDPDSADLLSDPVGKTELLIALEPFVVLVGWRPTADAAAVLRAVGADPDVVAALAAEEVPAAVRLLLGDRPVFTDADGWRSAATAAGLDEVAGTALAAVADRFGADPGVAVAALLRSEELAPGDAVFVPTGVPHAYVHGLGVEVMNSSDNVLRMGLTRKPMSVDHALAAVAAGRSGTVLRAPADGTYAPAGAPFTVRMVGGGEALAPAGHYRLVLAIDRTCVVVAGLDSYALEVGQALAVPAAAPPASVSTSGRAVVVSEVVS